MISIRALAVLACALSAAAAPGLSLSAATAESITDVDNFVVSTTLSNTGDETLRILNDPLSPLSKLPGDTFAVINSNGRAAQFSGIKAKFVPAVAAALGDYTTLEPGASVTIEHDLSEAYNLTSAGTGTYEVEPRNVFYLVGENDEITSIRADLGSSVTARVSGRLAKPRLSESSLARRATYIGCSTTRQSQLVTAAASAQTYATNSRNYLMALTSTSPRYAEWFGTWNTGRKATVQSHFTSIAGTAFSSFTYDCTCTTSGTYAYVYSNQPSKVWLCGAFWSAPNTGTDSKAGTLVHEASHYTVNGGTNDYAYGQTNCRNLATSNPSNAVMNADSHEYFTENNPFLS